MTHLSNFALCAYADYSGGAGLQYLEEMTTPVGEPRARFLPYAEGTEVASAKLIGLGRPQVYWDWSYLTPAQRDQLRTFCTGTSATVAVRTRQADNVSGNPAAYKTYKAEMYWPMPETYDFTYLVPFTLRFKILQVLA